MKLTTRIQSLPIKQKLLYGYLLSFLVVITLGNMLLYIYVRTIIEDNIESELKNTTSTILNMVQTAIDASITNYLRATAEKNFEIINRIYSQQKAGKYTEEEAKKLAADMLGSQTIGKTGYIYCVDSRGIMQVHTNKKLIGQNLSKHNFINEQKRRRNGYLEYDWANPGENEPRPKALYMTYFGPWDWIISASSYRNEFDTLINKTDLEKSILSIKFGATGYPYVIDSKGTLLIHPKLEGKNIYDSEDSNGHKFIQELCSLKNGSITYPWQNPGEPQPRMKLVYFNYIPQLDWIVASSFYLEEFYKPLKTVTYLTFLSVVFMVIIILILTWVISSSITKPITAMMSGLDSIANGDFTKRISHVSNDELGQLASYFNSSMNQLEESNFRINESEKKFRSIFENSVEGIFQFNVDGKILSGNPSFASMAGFDSIDTLLDAQLFFSKDLLVDEKQWLDLLELLHRDRTVKSFELQLRQLSNNVIWCLLNAKVIYDEMNGQINRIEGFLTDINTQKKIRVELEKRVEERNAWVFQLEQRDIENKLMHEMGDMLQACKTTKETFPVIEHFLHSFFPGDSSSLYLFEETLLVLDRYVPMNNENNNVTSFHQEECWALRQGKPYLFNKQQESLICDHIDFTGDRSLCIPLVAHGITTGLLHISLASCGQEDPSLIEKLIQKKLQLGVSLAEHLSLALANLKLREELQHSSLRDSLTGLSNRRHMDEIFKRQFFRLQRHDVAFSLLMIDVDHFKMFNDRYGHEIGDEALKVLGNHLKKHSRGEDLSCRFGGEEFVIILAATNHVQAIKRAKILLKDVSNVITIAHNNEKLGITISIGVATSPEHGTSRDTLLKSADAALYRAKENGRNRVECAI